MNFYTTLLVAGALGTDAFSLAVSMGLVRGRSKQIYLFPFIVAVLHVLMPLIGLWLGALLGKVAGKLAVTIGGIVLVLIGLHMLKEALGNESKEENGKSFFYPSKGAKPRILTGIGAMVLVAISVSLDALTAGLGLGAMKANLILTVITFGVVAGLMTMLGLAFGQRLGRLLGQKAQLIGGMILIVIGISMFL